jgi:hypothetical protein
VLQGLPSANLKPSELLGQQVPALPPVNVFIGTKKPEVAAGAAAQEPQIEGPEGRLAKKRKLAKKGTKENVEAVAAKERTPAAETASKPKPKPKKTPAASADGATSPAKPTPTSKPVTAPPSIAGTK